MRPRVAFLLAGMLTIAATAGCLLIAGTQGLTGGTTADAATDVRVAEGSAPEASADAGGTGDARPDAPPSDAGIDVIAVADATPDAPTPPTLVQQVTGSAQDAGTVMFTLQAPPSAGNMLILATANTDISPTSVTGTGAMWTQRAGSGDHVVTTMWTAAPATSASQAVTISWTPATAAFSGSLSEWKGISTYLTSQTDFAASGDVITPSIGASPGQLVFACGAMHGPTENNMVTGLAGGFTALQYAAIGDETVLAAYVTPSSPGVFQAQWSQTVGDGWDAIIAAFGP